MIWKPTVSSVALSVNSGSCFSVRISSYNGRGKFGEKHKTYSRRSQHQLLSGTL